MERKEGHEPRIREVSMHLQLAYRMWQKNKVQIFDSELATASMNVKYLRDMVTDQNKLAMMTEHISNAKAAAAQQDGEKVAVELSKAIALSEKMLRLLPKWDGYFSEAGELCLTYRIRVMWWACKANERNEVKRQYDAGGTFQEQFYKLWDFYYWYGEN